jgi:hypothetical protein
VDGRDDAADRRDAAVQPNPRSDPLGAATVTFSEPVTGFDAGDLSLTRDGQLVSLAGATVASTDGGRTYTVGGLAAATGVSGAYTLTVAAPAGIADLAGNPLAAGASQSFTATIPPPRSSACR